VNNIKNENKEYKEIIEELENIKESYKELVYELEKNMMN
jgi:hypothetical protein